MTAPKKHDPRVPFMMRALNTSPVAYKLAGLLCWKFGDNKGGLTFPSQERLASELGVTERHVRRVIKELIPIGLKVYIRRGPRTGKDMSFYSFGDPIIPDMGDLNAGQNSGHERPESTLNSGHLETPIPDIWSNNSGHERPPTQENTQKGTQERENARARDPLSEAPGDFHDWGEAKEGEIEILPPKKPAPPPRRGRGKPTPLPPDWKPGDEDWTHAAGNGLTADDIDREAQAFRDWASDGGRLSHNWSAAWRRFVSNSRQHRRNQRNTLAGRAGERARGLAAVAEELIQEARAKAATRGAGPKNARHAPEKAAQRPNADGPPWAGILAVIKRKVYGRAFSKVDESFRRKSWQDGIIEIAVLNENLYPLRDREVIGNCIKIAYPEVTSVMFQCTGTL
jgi:hypothetical protein